MKRICLRLRAVGSRVSPAAGERDGLRRMNVHTLRDANSTKKCHTRSVFGQQFVKIASSHSLLRPLFAVRQIHSFWSQPTNEFAHDQIAQDWQLRRRHRSFQCGDVTGPFSLVSMAGLLKMCFVVVRINCRGPLKLKNSVAPCAYASEIW